MSDDLSTASGGSFCLDDSLLYSNNDDITTLGIEVSTNDGQLEAVEVVSTDAQNLYPGDDAAYMQKQLEAASMGSQFMDSSQSNAYSLSTENVQLNGCIQSFEDPQLDSSIQQIEREQMYGQPGEGVASIESSQSFVYTSLDAPQSQPEPQIMNHERITEHTETVTYSQSEHQSQQPMLFHQHAQPEGIVYQDPHPVGVSHMPQGSQPIHNNPSYIPVQAEQHSIPVTYEQMSSTTTMTNFNTPSGNDNAYIRLDRSSGGYSEPIHGAHHSQIVTDHGSTHSYHVKNGDNEGVVAGLAAAIGNSSLNDRSIDTAAAINAGVGMVSTAVNALSSDTVQEATTTANNVLMGDPVAAVQAGVAVVMSGVRIGASIGSWNETRQKRKESQARIAAVHGATNPVIMSKVAIATQLDEALLVLSVLGQRLVVLEVINLRELPEALAVCRTACAQADSGDLLEHFDTLDGILQYTVTAALFFCAACWPMHIYRGFGTGVLDNFLWGCPHPQYSNGQTAGFRAIDRWISFLKSMPREVHLLTRIPHGLNRLVPTYGKNERMERRRLMNAYKQFVKEIEARGHPQPRDRSFRVVSWHIPFATWNSPFTFKSSGHYWEDFLRWQMDPGRLLHAWTIGGHLDLNYGEMMWLPSGVAESVARFLVGLPGTTFRLVPSSALDYGLLRLSPETRRAILEEGFETVKAIRDPQAESRRPSVNQNMFVPAPPPVLHRRPTEMQNPTATLASQPASQPVSNQSMTPQHGVPQAMGIPPSRSVPYMVPQARPSGPSGAMVQPSASQIAAHQHVMPGPTMLNNNPQMALQNIAQPTPSRPNGSMLPQHMSNLAAAQVSAHSPVSSFPASPNSNSASLSYPNHQTAPSGTMPHQQRLSSMPNIHSLDPHSQPTNPQSAAYHPNLQRVPSMPNPQPISDNIIHPDTNPLVAFSQGHSALTSQQAGMHVPHSNTNQTPDQSSSMTSSPSAETGHLHDPSCVPRSIPMGGFSMSRPPHQNPSNLNHSIMPENPHINPLTRRSTVASAVSITEGHLTTDFHPFPSNPQVHSPKSSVSRTSSQHSSSSHSSAQPQSSTTSYASQSTPTASTLSSTVGPTSNPLPFSANTQSQYPFPPAAQQTVIQKVKRRPVPPPPPPPPPPALRKVRAIHPFEPEEASELKFAIGDILDVLNDDTDDGWWEAGLDGKVGSIPASYVEDE